MRAIDWEAAAERERMKRERKRVKRWEKEREIVNRERRERELRKLDCDEVERVNSEHHISQTRLTNDFASFAKQHNKWNSPNVSQNYSNLFLLIPKKISLNKISSEPFRSYNKRGGAGGPGGGETKHSDKPLWRTGRRTGNDAGMKLLFRCFPKYISLKWTVS